MVNTKGYVMVWYGIRRSETTTPVSNDSLKRKISLMPLAACGLPNVNSVN